MTSSGICSDQLCESSDPREPSSATQRGQLTRGLYPSSITRNSARLRSRLAISSSRRWANMAFRSAAGAVSPTSPLPFALPEVDGPAVPLACALLGPAEEPFERNWLSGGEDARMGVSCSMSDMMASAQVELAGNGWHTGSGEQVLRLMAICYAQDMVGDKGRVKSQSA